MVAAFYLVVRVAFSAVISVVHRLDDAQRLVRHSLTQHQACDLVLYTGPHLVAVSYRGFRPAAFRPRAVEQPGLVSARKNSLLMLEPAQILAEIVPVYRLQRLFNVLFRQDVSQSQYVRPPLAHQLVRMAANSPLIPFVLIAVIRLVIVLAVPARLVVSLQPFLEPFTARNRQRVVAFYQCHFFSSTQRGKPQRADKRVGTENRDVVRVGLLFVYNPVAVRIELLHEVTEQPSDILPHAVQPLSIRRSQVFPIRLQNGAQHTVQGRFRRASYGDTPGTRQGQRYHRAVRNVAGRMHLDFQIGLAHGSFKRGI